MRRPSIRLAVTGPGLRRGAGLVLAGLFACGLCACTDVHLNPLPTVGSNPGDPAVAQPSLRNDVQPIFTARCAVVGCHNTATEANYGLVLADTFATRTTTINVVSGKYPPFFRVLPGNSVKSVLPSMLTDGEMPKTGPPLSPGSIQTIQNWIDQGAQDN